MPGVPTAASTEPKTWSRYCRPVAVIARDESAPDTIRPSKPSVVRLSASTRIDSPAVHRNVTAVKSMISNPWRVLQGSDRRGREAWCRRRRHLALDREHHCAPDRAGGHGDTRSAGPTDEVGSRCGHRPIVLSWCRDGHTWRRGNPTSSSPSSQHGPTPRPLSFRRGHNGSRPVDQPYGSANTTVIG